MKKVLLILVDGMRPDAMTACCSPVTEELRRCADKIAGVDRQMQRLNDQMAALGAETLPE